MSNQLLEKYDVAVSYLSEDEDLAYKIYTELGEIFKVFVYTQHQNELAGEGGIETLRDIFINRSKLIVILFKNGWGNTSWTSTEEKAIKDFGLKNQWKGILLVKLDDSKAPNWFPDSDIFLDYSIYGFDELIGIIKLRAQERGSEVKETTAVEKANILQIKRELKNKRKKFLKSEEGVREAQNEIKSLFEEIESICDEITSGPVNFVYKNDRENSYYLKGVRHDEEMGDYSFEVNVKWSPKYSNTLNGSKLTIEKADIGRTLESQTIEGREPIIEEFSYEFDVTPTMENRWRNIRTNKFLTTKKLADDIVKIIIDFKSS